MFYKYRFLETGIKFKPPKLDTCGRCDLLKAKIDSAVDMHEKEIAKQNLLEHHILADKGYDMKKEDKVHAKEDSSLKAYAFDLQQCLPTPYLRSNMSFYKRSLWTFNLTVHDLATNDAFCYMWHEALAARGANEIASCLKNHIQSLPENVTRLIFYSDNCMGQNRNSHVATMFSIMVSNASHIEMIDHKFLQPGHTHMECDIDHAQIEKKKKKSTMPIHHPRDWYVFVGAAGKKNEFKVIEMQQQFFKNYADVAKHKAVWRKQSQCGNKFAWTDVKWLRYGKKFGEVLYKTTLDKEEPFKVLNILKRGIPNVQLNEVPQRYTAPVKISKEKKNDLIDLLPQISPEFHDFYKNLATDAEVLNIDPDLEEDD